MSLALFTDTTPHAATREQGTLALLTTCVLQCVAVCCSLLLTCVSWRLSMCCCCMWCVQILHTFLSAALSILHIFEYVYVYIFIYLYVNIYIYSVLVVHTLSMRLPRGTCMCTGGCVYACACVRTCVRVGVRIPARTYSSVCSIILVRVEIVLGTKQHREFVSRL